MPKLKSSEPSNVLEVLFPTPQQLQPQQAGSPEDYLDHFIEEALKMEKAKTALALMRRLRAEAEAEAEKLTRTAAEEKPQLSPAEIEAAKLLADLPEDKRAKVLQVLQLLAAMRAGQQLDPVMALLPVVLGVVQSQPAQQSSPSEIAKAIIEAIKTGRELSQPQNTPSWVEKVVDAAVKKLLEEGVDEKTLAALMQQQPRVNPLDEIKTWYEFFKSLGLAVDPSQRPQWLTSPEIARIVGELQLQMMKLQHEMKMQEYRWKLRLLREKRRLLELRRRMQKRREMLARLAKAFAGILEEGGGETQGGERYTETQCPRCGARLVIPRGAGKVKCPSCGAEYRVEAQAEGGG